VKKYEVKNRKLESTFLLHNNFSDFVYITWSIFQGKQRLTSAHASTHEPDLSSTFGGSETGAEKKEKKTNS